MIKITNIKITADLSDDELFEKIYKKYKINKNDVTERRIIKKSIDARNKADIFYNYSVELECKNENKIKNVQIVKKEEPIKKEATKREPKKEIEEIKRKPKKKPASKNSTNKKRNVIK